MDSTDDLDYSYTLSELIKRNEHDDMEIISNGGDAIENKDDWFTDKESYEKNFNQLQEQLLSVMVEKQQLVEESKKIDKKSITELEDMLEKEKVMRKTAEARLKAIQSRRGGGRGSESSCNSADRLDLDGEPIFENDESGRLDEDGELTHTKHKFRRKLSEYKIYFWNIFHERISDFITDDDIYTELVEEEELSVRRLKENVNRFTQALQPIKGGFGSFGNLFSWKNPWITFSIFIIYSYSVYHDIAISMTLLLLLLQLSWNFLITRDIGKRILGDKKDVLEGTTKDEEGSVSLTERYQLVLLIAKKVQNNLGYIADGLEKIQNLFSWQHERASRLLFQCVIFGFFMSLLLPTNNFFMLVGLLAGIKLFIITPVYTTFPKVQKRYDDFQVLWEELPTHKENMRRKIQESIEIGEDIGRLSPEPVSTPTTSSSPNVSTVCENQVDTVSPETIVFCDRFQLPITEAPLYDWQEGRRCTLMDKESPLSSMKHGRMYLTSSYLCFERNQFHSKKNIAINLRNIVYVKKAKPISFMPGQGMAIEVQVKELAKPYIFGAIMSRDDAYDSIIKTGRLMNLPWSK